MIELDLPVCVLICLDVYIGLQKQKLVQNKQKMLAGSDQNTQWQISFHHMTLESRWKCVSTISRHQYWIFGIQGAKSAIFCLCLTNFLSWKPTSTSNEIKNTLAHQFILYMTLKSHQRMRSTKLKSNFRGQNLLFFAYF